MKITYLNCGTMYPRGASLFVPYQERSCCICMLIEAGDRLILVDTGFGTKDMENPYQLGLFYQSLLNIQTDPEEPAVRQIEKMGFQPEDVRDIIVTHLDPDHTGGIPDFPHANIHLSAIELDSFEKPRGLKEKERKCKRHLAHGPNFVGHGTLSDEKWFGMDCMRGIPGLPPEIVLVPMPGHTRGQIGVAVKDGDRWILHCGDAYYVKEEFRQIGKAPIGIRGFRNFADMNRSQSLKTVAEIGRILREHGDEVTAIASHDLFEYRNIFGKPFD